MANGNIVFCMAMIMYTLESAGQQWNGHACTQVCGQVTEKSCLHSSLWASNGAVTPTLKSVGKQPSGHVYA